ncbi:ribonuclease H protein [Trifolium medium]|uniref:Ribonuclease H protein n=1 Tax=Trifolium medium TaxID=97028 RepID=A0A392Q960_9FABA|nr:ribonuclease H protein [Trifolium medium]
MKLPVKVCKKIVQLQRKFLWWGEAKCVEKIAWVSWTKVCKAKSEGGLEIRDLRALNLALHGKWRWRLIFGGVGLWRDIFLARYGPFFPSPHLGGRIGGFRMASMWWRDVSLLGGPVDAISDWFSEWVAKKVGNELTTEGEKKTRRGD